MTDKEDKNMAMPELKQKPLRKPKRQRSNLYSSTTPERLEMMNEKSMEKGGLSNLTYGRVYGKE